MSVMVGMVSGLPIMISEIEKADKEVYQLLLHWLEIRRLLDEIQAEIS